MKDLMHEAQALFEYSQFLRRDFHRNPELGFRETRSAGIVVRELNQMGLEVTAGIAETGVVAQLEGAQPGPVVLMRFDMDALPIQEETGVEYASQNPGVMHACGHDGHMAVGLTVARLLSERRDQIKGTLRFVFQPAEEGLGGAERMLEAGILENPKVERTLSMHLWNERSVGWVGVTSGPLMAGADIFEVQIEGKGGHGALPHEAVDPLLAAAQITAGLQSIVARNVSPLDSAVVSVCRLRSGDAFNVIPQYAQLGGTFRTFRPEVREKIVERFEALVNGIAEAHGCQAKINIQRLTPAVINDAQTAERVLAAVEKLPGLKIDTGFKTMVSEDMAFIMEQVPGCYIMVGASNPERGLNYAHHHPKFDFDEAALTNAAAVMAACAIDLLG